MIQILMVDDEASVLTALQRALRQHFSGRLSCVATTDALQALSHAKTQHFDVVIADLRMPELDGISLLTLIAAVQPQAVRLMLTGLADFETAQRAINEAGVFRYLSKPWSDRELVAHITAAIGEARGGSVNSSSSTAATT